MTSPNLPQQYQPFQPNPAAEFQARINQHVMLGWRVESMTATMAILVSGHRCNHVLHGLLSLFTFGLWAPVWLILAVTESERRLSVNILEDGEVYVTPPVKSN